MEKLQEIDKFDENYNSLIGIADYYYSSDPAGAINRQNRYGSELGWYSSLTAGELAVAEVHPADANQLAEGDGINIDEFVPEDQEKIREYYTRILGISLEQAYNQMLEKYANTLIKRGHDDANNDWGNYDGTLSVTKKICNTLWIPNVLRAGMRTATVNLNHGIKGFNNIEELIGFNGNCGTEYAIILVPDDFTEADIFPLAIAVCVASNVKFNSYADIHHSVRILNTARIGQIKELIRYRHRPFEKFWWSV